MQSYTVIILKYASRELTGKRVKSLDKYRYILFDNMMSRLSLSSTFKLEVLSPTSAAAKQHAFRTYLTVQK